MELQKTGQAFQRLKEQETEPHATWDDTANEGEDNPPCQVIGFTGAKGGVGTTTVALNVAMTLVQGGQRVIYVELSPHLGTAAWLLKMPQVSVLGDSSAHLTDINRDFVNQLLFQHSTGLKVLCVSPWAQEVGYQVSTELVTALLRELKGLAAYLVLDFPLEPSFPSMCFLNACQILNLVTETDSICLALAKSQLESIHNHCDPPLFIIPVNRSGIPPADGLQGIQEHLGHEVPVLIPSAPELCYTAGVKKLPIVCINPNSVPALQFAQLGERILSSCAEDGSETNRDRRGRDRRKTDRRNRGGW
ncbi:MAG: AAA family ATPase [Nitrospirota bacterium]|nr:AAA family ATPase [Nitrospirota bacterium]